MAIFINRLCLMTIVLLGVLFNSINANSVNKSDFPQDFIFGAGSAAYQIEGAINIDGKGPSNWDYFTNKYPDDSTWDHSNGNISVDFYHRYKNDIKLMKKIGLTHFRFSISWSRILPKGTKAGGVNQLGIDFYNDLIDELLANGIQPFVSLFHWDVPQVLEEAYGGFLSHNIVSDFVDFANICFKEFGDRVKQWVTVNEPNYYALLGYGLGYQVPKRCTPLKGYPPCLHGGNSATEPYIVAHNLLLSHAAVVKLYRKHFQTVQKGSVGIAILCNWVEPFDEKPRTLNATARFYEHVCGWFFNPVTYGKYPKMLEDMVGDRLPKFTAKESKLLKKSYDFIGLNYFSTYLIKEDKPPTIPHFELDDRALKTFRDPHGNYLGRPTPVSWIIDYPNGLKKITSHLKREYDNPTLIITANGYATKDERDKTYSNDFYLNDKPRIHYLQGHIKHLHKAIKNGANVKGYFTASFLDSFEWEAGYTLKYGLIYVDRKNGLKRHLKHSAKWYQHFLHN